MYKYNHGKNWRTNAKKEEIATGFTAERRKRGLAGDCLRDERARAENKETLGQQKKHGRSFLSKAS